MHGVLEKYVEKRLEEWGIWARQDNTVKIGFPKKSNIARFTETGFLSLNAGFHPQKDSNNNPNAEEMERLVCQFSCDHRTEAEVLRDLYVSRGSKEEIAKKAKIAIRTVNERLRLAKTWLEGRLSQKFFP